MRAAIPSELLMRLLNATPEQYAAVEGILGVQGRSGRCRIGRECDGETACAPGARFGFRRSGRVWAVGFDGRGVFHLADTLGARYLDSLLHRPGVAVSAFDLEMAIRPERRRARARNSIQATLDPETVKTYLRELERLRRARDEAGAGGDLGGADRMDTEIEALEEALRGGHETGDAGERARNNVSKAVAVVRRQLAAGGPVERAFGEYVERFVSTGYECQFRPASGEVWA